MLRDVVDVQQNILIAVDNQKLFHYVIIIICYLITLCAQQSFVTVTAPDR